MAKPASQRPPAVDRQRNSATGPWVILAVAAAVFCVYVALVRPHRASDGAHPAVGSRLLRLELQPLTGASTPLTLDDLHDQVVLLNFWGTWCGPCKQEFPHLAAMAGKFKDRDGFKLIAVSCGWESDTELGPLRTDTEEFLQEEHSQLPTYADQNGWTRRNLAMVLNEEIGYPTTVVLDRSGIIRGVWMGYEPGVEQEVQRLVLELLADKPETASPSQTAAR